MNRKGFTLIELLATIVIIAIIMALVFPTASKMKKDNEGKICDEYHKMMIEYAKVSSKRNQDYIDLIELDELDQVKKDCDGYVVIDRTKEPPTYKAIISCNNGCKDDEFEELAGGSKGIILKADDKVMTYLESSPSFSYTISSVSSDSVISDPLTSEVTYTIKDSDGNVITVDNNTPAGVYTIIPKATVKPNYRLSIQNGTLTINKTKCAAPTNVSVSTNGIVTWTPSSNCASAQHQVKVGNNSYINASSGVNEKNAILLSNGEREISIKAKAPDGNYVESDASSIIINVCSAKLTKGMGISSVSGEGNYIEGSSIEINAEVSNGYTWGNWTKTDDNTQVVSTNNSFTTNECNINYTANAIGNTYTVNYVDNLYVSKSQYRNDDTDDLSAVYTENGSYLTINGTMQESYTNNIISNLWNLEERSFTAGDKYQITLNYVSGSYTRSPKFVFELTNGTSTFSNRDTEPKSYIMVNLPAEGQSTATYTVDASRAGATRLKFSLYQDSKSKIVFTNYKVQIIITKIHSKTVRYGEEYGELDTNNKVGFTFLGWYTGLTDGVNITSDSIYNTVGDQTLYAHYYYHKLHIRYKSWCHSAISWCGNKGTGYAMDSKCFATKNGDRIISSFGYGQYAGYKNGLMNWNNKSYICFYRSGQNGIDSGENEWQSYDNSSNTYSQSTLYTAANIANKEGCNLKTTDDCMVTLEVNWMGAWSSGSSSSSGSSGSSSSCCPNGGTYHSGYCYKNGSSGLLWQECSGPGVYYVNGICYKERYNNSC